MVAVKRSTSSSPPPSTHSSAGATPSPSTPKKKLKTGAKTFSPTKSQSSPTKGDRSTFSSKARGEFLDDIIAAGYKAVDLEILAEKYGVNKRHLIDQLKPNRVNIRSKAVKAIQEQ